jgi:nitronate monooxygenase
MDLFSDTLSLAAPILQAPMAGSQGHALAAAVCAAGGLGALPAAMLTPEGLDAEITALRQHTQRPFNVNFFAHTVPQADAARLARWHAALTPYYQALGLDPAAMPQGAGRTPFNAQAAEVIEKHRPAVVSFHFGLPADELLARVKRTGALVWSSATTVDEARWLVQHGVDAVIAQGLEAGGHRGMFLTDDLTTQVGTMALLPQIVAAVNVPVIAAGGVADAAGIRAAQALGASAVQIGTAYLCTPQALTSAIHRTALQSEAARHTALTNLFSGRPARGIVNLVMRELGPMCDAAPAFPLATAAITPLRVAAEAKGSGDFSPLWSGQNASQLQDVSAEVLTQSFIDAWRGQSA